MTEEDKDKDKDKEPARQGGGARQLRGGAGVDHVIEPLIAEPSHRLAACPVRSRDKIQ